MKTTTRLLLGMLASSAVMSGGTVRAHAEDKGPGPTDTDLVPVNSLVCPMITGGGLLAPTVNGLNSESAALSCRGVS